MRFSILILAFFLLVTCCLKKEELKKDDLNSINVDSVYLEYSKKLAISLYIAESKILVLEEIMPQRDTLILDQEIELLREPTRINPRYITLRPPCYLIISDMTGNVCKIEAYDYNNKLISMGYLGVKMTRNLFNPSLGMLKQSFYDELYSKLSLGKMEICEKYNIDLKTLDSLIERKLFPE
jgi:hypothetical protein